MNPLTPSFALRLNRHARWHRLGTLWRPGVLALGLSVASATAQTPTDVRVAVVIGNSAYERAPLLNPAHDAQAMASALRKLGFAVTELRDADRTQMVQAVSALRDSLKGKQGVGMLYYAGHGLQMDWQNYMVPVNARLSRATDVESQAVGLNLAVDALRQAGTRMNILVLDACRDNPFGVTSSGKGLAPMDAPAGTFLAYATAPGNVAEDGDEQSGNGLYTKYLLEELSKPASKIEDIFKRVRLSVRVKSGGRQIPWESTSLENDFYFAPPRSATNASGADEADFDREVALWEQTRSQPGAAAYLNYLKLYPSGHFSEIAQSRLDHFQAPLIQAQARPDDPLANSTRTERFRLGDNYEYQVKVAQGNTVEGSRAFTVTSIQDDVVEMNRGGRRFDRLGNIQTRGGHEWHDAQFFPAEYSVGRKWQLVAQIATDQREDRVHLAAKVAAREKIKVTAGTFDVFRVEVSGRGKEGHGYAWTFWMNPRYGMPIRWTEVRRNPQGKIRKSDDWELSALKAPRD